MITVINESRDYPLYHATSAQALANIINYNELLAKSPYAISKDKVIYGISLTRDLSFAKKWTKSQVIIVFRSDKLSNNYKLIPRGKTNYANQTSISKNGKAEEFLMISDTPNDSITNVKDYIKEIMVDAKVDKDNDLISQLKSEGISAKLMSR